MIRLIGAFACLLLAATTAVAIQIAPECKTMRDKIGCSCALANGGMIKYQKGGGTRWVSKLTSRQPTNEAFVKCNHRERGIK
jgi:hypothetical protein